MVIWYLIGVLVTPLLTIEEKVRGTYNTRAECEHMLEELRLMGSNAYCVPIRLHQGLGEL